MMTIVIIFSNEFSGIPSEWHSLDSDQAYHFDSLYPDLNCFQLSLAGKKVNTMHTGDRRLLKRAWTSAWSCKLP